MADRFYTTGGDGNWSNTNNWSTSSGGGSGASVPINTDDVFLDASSGTNLVVNSSTRACKVLDCTGYTGTLTFDANLECNDSIIIVAAMTLAGSSALVADETQSSTATYTSNGKVINVNMLWGGTLGGVHTLLDDWVFTGDVALARINDSSPQTINGFSMEAQGCDLKLGTGLGIMEGTTKLKCTGTGDLSGNGNLGGYGCAIDIDFVSGTRTLTGIIGIGGDASRVGTWTYIAGTIVLDASLELNVNFANSTMDIDLGTATLVIPKVNFRTTNGGVNFTNSSMDLTITDVHVNTNVIGTLGNTGGGNALIVTSFGDEAVNLNSNFTFVGDIEFGDWYAEVSTGVNPLWTFSHDATYTFKDRFEYLRLDVGIPTIQSDHNTKQAIFHIWHNCRVHMYGVHTKRINALSIGQGLVVQGETTHTGSSGVVKESVNVAVKGLNGTTPIDHPFYVNNVGTPVTISGTTQLSASDQVDTIVMVIIKQTENGIDWYKLTDVLVTDVNGDWSSSVPSGSTVFVECHYDDGTKYNSESHAFIVAS